MKFLDELKLFLLTKGMKPEVMEQVAGAADALMELVQTATERNHAQATASWIQSATMLLGLSDKLRAANPEQAETIHGLAMQALKNAGDLLDGSPAAPPMEPVQA